MTRSNEYVDISTSQGAELVMAMHRIETEALMTMTVCAIEILAERTNGGPLAVIAIIQECLMGGEAA